MNEHWELLDVVALSRDLPDKGLVRGQVGTIVEVHGNGIFEVEFSDEQGRAYAMAALPSSDLLRLHFLPNELKKVS